MSMSDAAQPRVSKLAVIAARKRNHFNLSSFVLWQGMLLA